MYSQSENVSFADIVGFHHSFIASYEFHGNISVFKDLFPFISNSHSMYCIAYRLGIFRTLILFYVFPQVHTRAGSQFSVFTSTNQIQLNAICDISPIGLFDIVFIIFHIRSLIEYDYYYCSFP